MINFRYHLASLIAVFLALALGVVMGSTVIDRAIVSSLRDRIDQVEANAERRKAENDQLRSDLGRLQGSVNEIAPFAVAGRLTGVPVAVVAARGVDDAAVKDTVALLQEAGALAPGILWLENAWGSASPDDTAKFVAVVPGPDAGARDRAFAVIAGRTPDTGNAAFPALVTAGLVRYEPVGPAGQNTTVANWGGANARLLIVDGPGAKVADPAWTVTLARAAVGARVPTEVAEVYVKTPEASERGTRLQGVQRAADLGTVTTIDNLDLVEGRIAAVLGLADLGRGVSGRYGYGPDATRSIPAPPA